MIHIQIGKAYSSSIKPAFLRKPALEVLKILAPDQVVDMTIVLTDDEYLQQLNHQFLGIDAPTDVLSFPSDETDPDTEHSYLGDIAISYPRAAEQAKFAGHPVESEIQLLVVHGVLHLLGYDHTTPELKADMWQVQARMLEHLSVEIKKLPED